MNVLICIDDTDNLESRGTGHLASMLASDIESNNWGRSTYVTRHQLFVHPDVPYTSHNSAMCFAADMDGRYLDSLIEHACTFLESQSAPGSDPGLCVTVLDDLRSPADLIDYGRRAKREVITKALARDMAARHGLHLSEHGGTGGGIIGALAGIGLRLSGNDGRVKGKLHFGAAGEAVKVRDILSGSHVNVVKSLTGKPMADDVLIRLGEKVKAVFLDGLSVLLVVPEEDPDGGVHWRTIPRQELNAY